MRGGWVYIMTNRPNGVLYIGVTSDLSRRVYEHRQGAIAGFTKRYGLKRLVWFTRFEDIRDALQHEKNMKHWLRAWKAPEIIQTNPDWCDLYDTLAN
jgi:putative endonuclease